MIPNFIPLMDALIIMLFSVIISQGANNYIQMEKRTIKVMKTIPVKYSMQLFIKVIIPFILSFVSLFVSLLVLLIGKHITFITFIFTLILSALLLGVFDLISLKEELSIRNHKPRSTYVSNLYSYMLPLLFFLITALFSYIGLPLILAFVIGIVLVVVLGLPHVISLKKNMNSLFMDLDVIN